MGPLLNMTLAELSEYAVAHGAALGDDPVRTLQEYVACGILRPKPGQALFDESHLAVILLVQEDLAAGYTLEQIRARMKSPIYLSDAGLEFVRKHKSSSGPDDAFPRGRPLTRAEMAVIAVMLLDAGLDASEAQRLFESMFVLGTGEPAFHLSQGDA